MDWLWYVFLIGGCSAIVLGVIISHVVAKKKGKNTCGCGCSDCSACPHCREARERREKP